MARINKSLRYLTAIVFITFVYTPLFAQVEKSVGFLITVNDYVSIESIDFGNGSISEGDSDAINTIKICNANSPFICLVSDSPDYNFAFPRNFENETSWVFAGYAFKVNGTVKRNDEVIYSISSTSISPRFYRAGLDTNRLAPYNYKGEILYSSASGMLSIKEMTDFDGVSNEPSILTFLDGGLDIKRYESITPEHWLLEEDQVSELFDPNFKREPGLDSILGWRN